MKAACMESSDLLPGIEGRMAKLIDSMLTSLNGYTEDEHGRFG